MICKILNCRSKVVGWGLCSRHWQQQERWGFVKTTVARSSSPYVISPDGVRVALLNVHDDIVGWTTIDYSDIDLVRGKRVRSDKGRYAIVGSDGYLHRMIVAGFEEVDHISNDGLDNRRANLRGATHRLNCANKHSGKLKGVRPRYGRFEAHISNSQNGTNRFRYLGMFDTRREAAVAYNEAALEQWGEFAHLNDLSLLT